MRVGPDTRARWLTRAARGGSEERGFSLIEVIVALAILAFVMAATAGLFINSLKRTNGQGSRQVAVSLANQTMSKARAVDTTNLVDERPQSLVAALIAAAPSAVVLTDDNTTTANYDPSTADATGNSAAIPITQNVTINSQLYVIDAYVDQCYRNPSTQVCGSTSDPSYTQLWRITVDVHWQPKTAQGGCQGGRCDYVVSSLRDSTSDPTFNNNPGASLPAPSISTITNIPAGYGTAMMSVTGTGFVSGATVTVPTGGTVVTVSYVNPTLMYVTYTAPAVTPPNTSETLNLTNPDGQLALKTFTVTAAAAPTVTSLSPSSVVAYSSTGSLTINGTGLQAGATVTIGSGACPSSTCTQFTNVTPNAAGTQAVVGPYTAPSTASTPPLTWKNSDTQSASRNLTVTAAPRPTLSSVSPSSVVAYGSATTLTLTGTGFQPGLTISIVSGGGSVASAVYSSSTTATVQFTPPVTAGPTQLRITNSDGQSSLTNVTVTTTAAAKPAVTSLSPASGTEFTSIATLTITGSGFQAGALVTIGGLTFTPTSITPTSITLSSVNLNTAGATLAVKVTNTDTQFNSSGSTLNIAFATPTVTSISPTSASKNSTVTITITGTKIDQNATPTFTVSGSAVGSVLSKSVNAAGTQMTVSYQTANSAATVKVGITQGSNSSTTKNLTVS